MTVAFVTSQKALFQNIGEIKNGIFSLCYPKKRTCSTFSRIWKGEFNSMQRFLQYIILLFIYLHILLLSSICCALLHRKGASHTFLQVLFCCHPPSFWFDQDWRKNIFLVNFFSSLYFSFPRCSVLLFHCTVTLPAAAPHGSTFLGEL